jgi:hypothetical protein
MPKEPLRKPLAPAARRSSSLCTAEVKFVIGGEDSEVN